MLAAAGTFFILSSLIIAAVSVIRLTTDLASPGWASTVIFGVLILFLQIITSTLMTMLLLLSNRSQRNVVPMRDYADYVLSMTELLPEHESPVLDALVALPHMQSLHVPRRMKAS